MQLLVSFAEVARLFTFIVSAASVSAKLEELATAVVKSHKILLFVSITTGTDHWQLRDAIRGSWLQPCIKSPHCDFRFFIDKVRESIPQRIMDESKTYNDMVGLLKSETSYYPDRSNEYRFFEKTVNLL